MTYLDILDGKAGWSKSHITGESCSLLIETGEDVLLLKSHGAVKSPSFGQLPLKSDNFLKCLSFVCSLEKPSCAGRSDSEGYPTSLMSPSSS